LSNEKNIFYKTKGGSSWGFRTENLHQLENILYKCTESWKRTYKKHYKTSFTSR